MGSSAATTWSRPAAVKPPFNNISPALRLNVNAEIINAPSKKDQSIETYAYIDENF